MPPGCHPCTAPLGPQPAPSGCRRNCCYCSSTHTHAWPLSLLVPPLVTGLLQPQPAAPVVPALPPAPASPAAPEGRPGGWREQRTGGREGQGGGRTAHHDQGQGPYSGSHHSIERHNPSGRMEDAHTHRLHHPSRRGCRFLARPRSLAAVALAGALCTPGGWLQAQAHAGC